MSAVPSRLRGEQLTLAYGNKTIAESLNVTIPDGHFTAIIGPNGCGKSDCDGAGPGDGDYAAG